MDPGPRVALASPLDLCPECGFTSREGDSCPHCGAALKLEVRIDPSPTDPSSLFKAARVVDQANVGVSFADARAALKKKSPVAEGMGRSLARRLKAELEETGFRVSLRPAKPATKRASANRSAVGVVSAVALLVALAFLGGLFYRSRPAKTPSPAEPPAETKVPARAEDVPPSKPVTAPEEPPAAAHSASEIYRLALPAIATVTCPGRLGTGFFVGPDRLVTNAHVTCGAASDVTVKLQRGRELIGRVKAIDEWLDFAVVDVVGAQIATPLAVGDSTTLEAGQPIVIIGNPMGLEATLHEGRVSAVGRNLEGVAHIQLNADVNPGNSGGPLLDGEGKVLGIVTLGVARGGGLGFALPIEYLLGAASLSFAKDRARERWEAILARVEEEQKKETEKLSERLGRVVLLSARASQDGLALSVMKRDPGGSTELNLEVREGGTILCETTAEVGRWVNLEEKLVELAADVSTERRVRFMVRNHLSDGVEGGVAKVSLVGCPKDIPAKAVLMVKGDSEQALPFPVHEVADARREQAALTEQIEAEQAAKVEARWRAAFHEAHDLVSKLQSEESRMKKALDEGRDPQAIGEAHERLPKVEARLVQARGDLEELEREASKRGVPLEWRR